MPYESYGNLDYGQWPWEDPYATSEQPIERSSTETSDPSQAWYTPNLKKGDKGEGVTAWQKALQTMGYGSMLGSYGADGDFGSKTKSATKQFQKDNGLSADGKVGYEEWYKYYSKMYQTAHPTSSYTPSTSAQQAAAQAPIATQASMFPGGLMNQPWFYPVATVAAVGTMVLILKQMKK